MTPKHKFRFSIHGPHTDVSPCTLRHFQATNENAAVAICLLSDSTTQTAEMKWEREPVHITSAKSMVFWISPPPPCPQLVLIYSIESTQPSLLHLLFLGPPPPATADVIFVCPQRDKEKLHQ